MNLHKFRHIIARTLFIPIVCITFLLHGLIDISQLKIHLKVENIIKSLPNSLLIPIEKPYVNGCEKMYELIQNGNFYDVIRFKVDNNNITYYCYEDTEETENALLSISMHQNSDIRQLQHQVNVFSEVFGMKYIQGRVLQTDYFQSVIYFFNLSDYPLSEMKKDIFTPPPKA